MDEGEIMLTLTDINLENQRVLIREDLNVPIENGKINSEAENFSGAAHH